MPLTDYHAKLLATELTQRFAAGSLETLAGALVDAKVDLNPHQVDAALFAFQSPLSKGEGRQGRAGRAHRRIAGAGLRDPLVDRGGVAGRAVESANG
ncbi:MAG: hypothetical protein ACYCWW_17495 [Deltaproteobacteria bacterium]